MPKRVLRDIQDAALSTLVESNPISGPKLLLKDYFLRMRLRRRLLKERMGKKSKSHSRSSTATDVKAKKREKKEKKEETEEKKKKKKDEDNY